MKRVICWVRGHRWVRQRFDGRGRRIKLEKCARCGAIDHSSIEIVPLNRQVRRRMAQRIAREVAR